MIDSNLVFTSLRDNKFYDVNDVGVNIFIVNVHLSDKQNNFYKFRPVLDVFI